MSVFYFLNTFNIDEWYVDGTFKISPTLFAQVFVIMAGFNGGMHPCVYALLPNKEQATYTCLIVELRNRFPEVVANIR